MDHYLDLRLLPDPEFPVSVLMNALFAKLHRVLVQLENHHLGISFPEVGQNKPSLGGCLRIHGSLGELNKLQTQNWLTGMRDHVEVTAISSVPAGAQHRQVRRVQVKSNAERLRRRYLKRHPGVSEDEVALRVSSLDERRLKLPFVQMKSQSTGQQFCLFIEHLPLQQQVVPGEFNCYGLSVEATIPWF